jgi:hypothetical protein
MFDGQKINVVLVCLVKETSISCRLLSMRLQREDLWVSNPHFTLKVTWQLSVVNDRTGGGTDQVYGPLIGSLTLFLSQRENQSVWVGYVDPWSVVLKQSKNSFDNAGSSLFSKERTCLDSVVKFSLFQRKNPSWWCCAVLSFSKKQLILTVLCGSLFSKERTHPDKRCAVLSLEKRELVLTVLCSSLFSKETTHLDKCCVVLSFSKKGWVSKGQVYIWCWRKFHFQSSFRNAASSFVIIITDRGEPVINSLRRMKNNVETFVPILCFPKMASQLEKHLFTLLFYIPYHLIQKRGFGTFPTAIRSGPQQAHRILCTNRVVSIEFRWH